MMPDLTVWISLAIAAAAMLMLAAIIGRRRRWRDPQRFFSWADKQILIAQAHGRCEHKNPLWFRCTRPGQEADHVIPWSRSGATQIDNGQLLCSRHNQRKAGAMPNRFYRWRLHRRRKKYTT